MGVLALDISSGNPAMLLRLEELLWGLWLLGEEAIRLDTNDTDGSRTDTYTDGIIKNMFAQSETQSGKKHPCVKYNTQICLLDYDMQN